MFGVGNALGEIVVGQPTWLSDTKVAWTVTGKKPGRRFMSFSVLAADGTNECEHSFDLTVLADRQCFKDRCTTAESTLNTSYAKGRAWFLDCFMAYKEGYERQTAALHDQAESDRLAGQLLLGVLFAAFG